jgi:hypothetical protein
MRRSVLPASGARSGHEVAETFGERVMALTGFGRLMFEPQLVFSLQSPPCFRSEHPAAWADERVQAVLVDVGEFEIEIVWAVEMGCHMVASLVLGHPPVINLAQPCIDQRAHSPVVPHPLGRLTWTRTLKSSCTSKILGAFERSWLKRRTNRVDISFRNYWPRRR